MGLPAAIWDSGITLWLRGHFSELLVIVPAWIAAYYGWRVWRDSQMRGPTYVSFPEWSGSLKAPDDLRVELAVAWSGPGLQSRASEIRCLIRMFPNGVWAGLGRLIKLRKPWEEARIDLLEMYPELGRTHQGPVHVSNIGPQLGFSGLGSEFVRVKMWVVLLDGSRGYMSRKLRVGA